MGAPEILMGVGLALSTVMSASQAKATNKAQTQQNEMIRQQQEAAEKKRREGTKLSEAEGLAAEEARRRRLTLSSEGDKRRTSINLVGGDERKPQILDKLDLSGGDR